MLTAQTLTRIYVNATATGANNGSTWVNAYTKLQDALVYARANNSVTEIWMAKGTYYPDEGGGKTNNDRSAAFAMKNNLAIYGGFTGGETAVTQRNWGANPTILSGDIDQNDGPNFANNGGNALHVVANDNGVDNSAVLDGFIITAGNATGAEGGGMYNIVASPTIINCSFLGNSAEFGGGMFISAAPSIEMINCSFFGNAATIGGGIYFNSSTGATLINCSIAGNNAIFTAGAIYNNSNSLVLTNCIVWANSTGISGDGPNVSYSIVQGDLYPGVGNSNADPLFISQPDFTTAPTAAGNLRLQACSPAINTGDNTANNTTRDLDGNTRKVGAIDRGAYEVQGVPEINVQGNSVTIVDGDATPSTTDNTDFGSNDINANVQKTFTIQNTGTGNLNVSGITMSGTDAALFTVSSISLPATVTPNASVTFTISFAPSSTGLKTATINITSNDCDEATYNFAVQGSATLSRLYVKANATGAGNGSTWTNAYTKLQDALVYARANNNIIEIWVAAGTYYPDEGGGKTNNDRSAAFDLKSNLAIYGGFAGSETQLSQRNLNLNTTILSGDVGTVGSSADNSYRIVYCQNLTGARLDGLTMRDANYIQAFNGNQGGGLRLDNAAATVANCVFRNNAKTYGGGVAIYNSTAASFVNCLFFDNYADFDGGGALIEGCSPAFINCTFANNNALDFGSAVSSNQFNGSTNPVFTNCIFWNTRTRTATIYNNQGAGAIVRNSIVQDNYSGTGNSNQNPLYVDAANGNLRLQACSPAINTGDNSANNTTLDLDGNTRKVGAIDMGAYEYQTQPFLPEINVQGNSVTIVDGDVMPSATDNTDFGSGNVNANVQKTFTIQNTGSANLTVSSITMNGPNAAMFSISGLTFPATVAPGGSATFTVTFTPSSAGVKTATVNITSNDCDEATYDFAVQGTGTIPLITYYLRSSATNLSQVSSWTDAPLGTGGNSPANFTSANQLFNVTNNVVKPTVLGAWTLSGGSNLILNNGDSLIFRPSASLTIGTGSTADFNGKSVTLKSDATGTAFIGEVKGSLTNASNVTVERYISSNNNRAYRLLTPSVNTTASIRANWQEGANNGSTGTNLNPVPGYGVHITGSTTGANGFDATQTGQGSLFTYNAAVPQWAYINNTNSNTLQAKNGYLIYVRGDRSIDLNSTANPLPSSNTTLRATGSLLTGTQTFNGTTGNTGFSLITNPFAAPINWQAVYNSNTSGGLTQFYTLWDPNIGSQGGYVTVSADGIISNPSSNASTSIQSGQAFFVQASGAAAPTVNIIEAHKSTTNNIDVFRLGSQTELFATSLFYTNTSGVSVNADAVTSAYNNDYNKDIDNNDASQIANWDEDIAIARGSSLLSIESRPLIDAADTILITMARMQQRGYEWQFNASNFNAPGLSATLIDNFLTTRTPINLTGTTVIPFTVTGNSASAAADRFKVVFQSTNLALPVTLSNVRAYQKAGNIEVEWTAQTEVNLNKYEVEKSLDARQFIKAGTVVARNSGLTETYTWLDVNAANGANYYRIKAISKTGEINYSRIVRVDIGKAANEITVYPNPVTDNTIGLGLNLPKGNYVIILTNKLGQSLYTKKITHQGGSATESLQLTQHLAQGVYQLTISDGENKYVKQVVKN